MTQEKTSVRWSSNIAYAVGLLATDGCLSLDGRHIDLTSKDREQLENFLSCLKSVHKITSKKSGSGSLSLRVQFSDVNLYRFLLKVGLTPHKSKSIEPLKLPKKYFYDFLRGHFDGDGTIYCYQDTRWRSSFMFYFCFVSASLNHISWIRKELNLMLGINGSLTKARTSSTYQLKYAKKESLVLIPKLYYNNRVICLSRKRNKIYKILKTQQKEQTGAGAVMVARLA